MKTSELTGRALAWAVGTAEGCRVETWHTKSVAILFPGNVPRAVPWNPHTDWSQGGPIIDEADIELWRGTTGHIARCWASSDADPTRTTGETKLIAAMRCYVASKLGDDIELPEELL